MPMEINWALNRTLMGSNKGDIGDIMDVILKDLVFQP